MPTNPQPRLSVVIITLDAERLLETVLESVSWASEIVIVDSGSADRTEEIARRFTSNFHIRPYEGQGVMRQHSLALATGDWILYIDADEVVTPALRRSIEAAICGNGRFAGYRMELQTYFMGRWFGTRGWRREWKVRLFARDRGQFNARIVHEGAVIEGPIGTLDGLLLHYPYSDLSHAVDKMNRYSTMGATILRNDGIRTSGPMAFARASMRFFRDYVLGGDLLYGGAGLVRSTLMAYYTMLKYVKTDNAVTDWSPRPPADEHR